MGLACSILRFSLISLIRYSPEFNPIENLWSKLKTILRRIGARTYQDLDEAIATAYAQISLDNIRIRFITKYGLFKSFLMVATTPILLFFCQLV